MLAEGDALFVEEEYGAAVDKYSEVREAPPLRRPHHLPTPSPPAHTPPLTTRISTPRAAAAGGAHRSIAHCKGVWFICRMRGACGVWGELETRL